MPVKSLDKLTASELSKILEKKGVKVSYRSILRYAQNGFIPDKYVHIEKYGRRKLYYFKPEVIDFLIQKLA